MLAILVGSHIGNTPVKFESRWPKVSGEASIEHKVFTFSFFSCGGHFGQRSETVLAILVDGQLSNILMKVE